MSKEIITKIDIIHDLLLLHNASQTYLDWCNEISEEITKLNRQARALQLVKEKKVYPPRLLMWKKNWKFYNAEMPEDRQLTEEEFNFLVEELS